MNNNYCPIPGASQPKEQPETIVERIGEPAFLEQLAGKAKRKQAYKGNKART